MSLERITIKCVNIVKNRHLLNTFQYKTVLGLQPSRESSYRSSKPMGPPSLYTDVEISRSPEEMKYVERLLGSRTVPVPSVKSEYPSGWKPPSESCYQNSYYISRNRNHMYPVYLKLQHRGMKKTTQLKLVQGDIWALHGDLKKYLEDRSKKDMVVQVHEMNGHINIKGDYVSLVEEWLQFKGF